MTGCGDGDRVPDVQADALVQESQADAMRATLRRIQGELRQALDGRQAVADELDATLVRLAFLVGEWAEVAGLKACRVCFRPGTKRRDLCRVCAGRVGP